MLNSEQIFKLGAIYLLNDQNVPGCKSIKRVSEG